MDKLLHNKSVLITKDADDSKSMQTLTSAGATVIYFPTIKIVPIHNNTKLIEAIKNFSVYDYLVLTSANAAEIFYEQSKKYSLDLNKIKTAAVGRKTAEVCRNLGIPVSLIPVNFSAKGLIDLFRNENLFGKKVLIPCSAIAKNTLSEGLSELGASVDAIPVYNVEVNDKNYLAGTINILMQKKPDVFIFTSPSSFDAFLELIELSNPAAYFKNTLVTAIGPTTEAAIKERGIIVNIIPKKSALEDLEKAIIEYYLFQEI